VGAVFVGVHAAVADFQPMERRAARVSCWAKTEYPREMQVKVSATYIKRIIETFIRQ
jgi:hypothetical protein